MRTKMFGGLAVALAVAGVAWAFTPGEKSGKPAAAGAGCCVTGDCCCPGQGACCDPAKRATGDAVKAEKTVGGCCSTGECCCPGQGACCAVGAKAAVKAVAPACCVTAPKTFVVTAAVTADDKAHGHAAHFAACAKACSECALACDTCSAHCTQMLAAGKKEHLKMLQLCQDCSAICSAAAGITAKGGPLADLICTACADACKRCAAECDLHAGDPASKKCADACRACEKACREMVKHAGAAK